MTTNLNELNKRINRLLQDIDLSPLQGEEGIVEKAIADSYPCVDQLSEQERTELYAILNEMEKRFVPSPSITTERQLLVNFFGMSSKEAFHRLMAYSLLCRTFCGDAQGHDADHYRRILNENDYDALYK